MESCLKALIAQMEPDDEIIMVDNGSTDRTVAIAESLGRVSTLKSSASTISAVRNFGASKAAGDILAFIDIDCYIREGWRKAVESILSDKSIDATGSLYDLPEDATWVETVWWSSRPKEATKTHYMVGGNFVIRSHVFQAIRGFDEKLVTDEDSDIGERLNQEGYVIVDDPRAGAVHHGNPKTLWEFVSKEKWHASSIMETMKRHGLDKPMVMTFGFIGACLFALMAALYSIMVDSRALVLLPVVLVVPILTAGYRVYQFRQYRLFMHLTLLYLLFYVVRSLTVVEMVVKGMIARRGHTESA